MKENQRLREKSGVMGISKFTLFDGEKLKEAKAAMRAGASEEEIALLLDEAKKPLFQGNFLWKALHKLFSVDIKSPFTGCWVDQMVLENMVVNVGLKAIAQQTGGTTTSPMTALAVGTGSTGPSASDSSLGGEISSGGGSRGAASVTNETDTTTGDTEKWSKTWTFTSGFAVTEEGILDDNASGGVLLARNTFSAVNVTSGDSLQIDHEVTFARA